MHPRLLIAPAFRPALRRTTHPRTLLPTSARRNFRSRAMPSAGTVVNTSNAPAAIGPYCQAIKTDVGLLYTSGQIPLSPSGELVGEGDVEAQTKQALTNLKAVLEEGGASLESVVKTTVFIKDMNDFAKINAVYGQFFSSHKPARSCVEVARLPKDVLVEVEAIARV